MKPNKLNKILSIETAIGGGSFSIFDETGEIESIYSINRRSKAEDLLSEISSLLSRNKISKSEINKIIYSKGPGSQTGIRIGAATAKGLVAALNCSCLEISVLDALVFKATKKGIIQASVQISKNEVCRQFFESSESNRAISDTEVVNIVKFFEELESNTNISETIILSGLLNEDLRIRDKYNLQYCEPKENIARLLYLASEKI